MASVVAIPCTEAAWLAPRRRIHSPARFGSPHCAQPQSAVRSEGRALSLRDAWRSQARITCSSAIRARCFSKSTRSSRRCQRG